MIQRIQTLYLLLIAGIMLAILFLPIADVYTGGACYTYKAFGFSNAAGNELLSTDFNWILVLVCSTASLLSLFTIFIYKNRKLQVKLCYLILLLLVGSYVVMGLAFWLPDMELIKDCTVSIKPVAAIPFIAIVLDVLAIQRISKDEKLVRSLDRLR